MHAEIRRLHSPDVETLESFRPEDEGDFLLLIQVMAGPVGSAGEESFDIEVMTPRRLAAKLSGGGPISGRHMLFLDHYDHEAIVGWLERAVSKCTGPDWPSVAEKLGRVGHWEFEDYEG